MLIYFVRHGQTDHNLQGIIQGHLDTPLNNQGRHEASRLADALARVHFDQAYSSSLIRARETAEIVVARHKGLDLAAENGLKERYLGSLQGHVRRMGDPLPRDVEAGDKFRRRITTWFQEFLASHVPRQETESSPTVLVVSHGAFLSALLPLLLGSPFDFTLALGVDTRRHCLNTSIMRVSCDYDTITGHWRGKVLGWGEVDHLYGSVEDLSVADDV